MIQQVIVAPKLVNDEEGLVFAIKNQLGYEIPHFQNPSLFKSQDTYLGNTLPMLLALKGPLILHGAVNDLNPISTDEDIRRLSKLRYKQALEMALKTGCRFVVFHTNYHATFDTLNPKAAWSKMTADFWQEFAVNYLENNMGLVVLLKNVEEHTPDLLRNLIDKIDHPQIKACIDTEYANLFSTVSLSNWLDTLEHQLSYVQLNNNHGHKSAYNSFNEGSADLNNFISHLIRIPFKVNVAIKIDTPKQLEENCTQLQTLLLTQQTQVPEKTFLI